MNDGLIKGLLPRVAIIGKIGCVECPVMTLNWVGLSDKQPIMIRLLRPQQIFDQGWGSANGRNRLHLRNYGSKLKCRLY